MAFMLRDCMATASFFGSLAVFFLAFSISLFKNSFGTHEKTSRAEKKGERENTLKQDRPIGFVPHWFWIFILVAWAAAMALAFLWK